MPTVKHQTKKAEILEKGMEIMWLNGYNGTSVKDIVNAAGIPKGSFYFYFDSKTDFAVKAIQRYLESMVQRSTQMLMDEQLSPLERLRKHYEYRIVVMANESEYKMGCFVANLAMEMSDTCDTIRQALMQVMQHMNTPIVNTIREAMETGAIKHSNDPEALAQFIENSWRGTLTSMKVEKNDKSLQNFQQFLFSHLLK